MKKFWFILIAISMLFIACDFQMVEPEISESTQMTLNKTVTMPTPFTYMQEFHEMDSNMFTWWIENTTVYIKFTNGNTPLATNYFLFVQYETGTMFYYIHTVQPFFSIPYIGTSSIEDISLYGIILE